MCGHSNVTAEALFPNFGSVMEHLSEKIMKQQWGFYSVSDPNAPVFGFAQCHKDLSEVDCQLCFAEARTKIPHCLPASRGRIYLEGCFIRYDDYEFYDESVNAKYDSDLCSGSNKRLKGREEGEGFRGRVEAAVMSVAEEALGSRAGGFGAAEESSGAPGAYALGQCWNTINSTGCGVCLEDAWREVRKCLPAAEGRALNAGCYLRYSTRNFFSEVELTMDGDCKHLTSLSLLNENKCCYSVCNMRHCRCILDIVLFCLFFVLLDECCEVCGVVDILLILCCFCSSLCFHNEFFGVCVILDTILTLFSFCSFLFLWM